MSAPVFEQPFDVPEEELPPLPAIDLNNLHAGYGRVEVLHGIDLVVPRGTVVALMGPNGAGKTTTLNTIAGFVQPTKGCVHVAGLHINNVSPEARAKAGVCSIPEGRGVFPNLAVNENLRVFTHSVNKPFDEVQERAFTRFPRLGERRNQLAGTLSGFSDGVRECSDANPGSFPAMESAGQFQDRAVRDSSRGLGRLYDAGLR